MFPFSCAPTTTSISTHRPFAVLNVSVHLWMKSWCAKANEIISNYVLQFLDGDSNISEHSRKSGSCRKWGWWAPWRDVAISLMCGQSWHFPFFPDQQHDTLQTLKQYQGKTFTMQYLSIKQTLLDFSSSIFSENIKHFWPNGATRPAPVKGIRCRVHLQPLRVCHALPCFESLPSSPS